MSTTSSAIRRDAFPPEPTTPEPKTPEPTHDEPTPDEPKPASPPLVSVIPAPPKSYVRDGVQYIKNADGTERKLLNIPDDPMTKMLSAPAKFGPGVKKMVDREVKKNEHKKEVRALNFGAPNPFNL